ncbi:MAG: hypothetical protein GX025_10055 [Clostridiales bacterium]|nr:hypothetical protein [Clostridiales bacterium]
MESHEKILVFAGFIEHVVEGFPTKVYLQDNAFILRFGNIQKIWNENATLQQIVSDCIPVAQDGFTKERKKLGFTRPIPELRYSVEDKNVQAVTTSLSFRNWSGRSPYDTVQKLMQLLVLYGGVSRGYNVFIGAGVTKSDRPQTKLDTRYNVVERDITPVDGRFVDYEVKVVGILKDGTKWTATGGYGTSRSKTSQSEFEVTHGQVERYYAPHNTKDGIQNFADQMLAKLRGLRNRGSVTTLLYPKLDVMDWIAYKDTVFPALSGGYYVLDYQFKANEKGYFQTISLTDQVFSL